MLAHEFTSSLTFAGPDPHEPRLESRTNNMATGLEVIADDAGPP